METIIIVVALTVFWILSALFIKTTAGFKTVLFICCVLLAKFANSNIHKHIELDKLKSSYTSSTIPTLSNVTNGLYRIVNSYVGPGKMNLVILHQERVTSIDPIRRVLATTPISPLPILVSLDHPLTSKDDTNQIYTGYVEVNTDQSGKKEIRDYYPFKHME